MLTKFFTANSVPAYEGVLSIITQDSLRPLMLFGILMVLRLRPLLLSRLPQQPCKCCASIRLHSPGSSPCHHHSACADFCGDNAPKPPCFPSRGLGNALFPTISSFIQTLLLILSRAHCSLYSFPIAALTNLVPL